MWEQETIMHQLTVKGSCRTFHLQRLPCLFYLGWNIFYLFIYFLSIFYLFLSNSSDVPLPKKKTKQNKKIQQTIVTAKTFHKIYSSQMHNILAFSDYSKFCLENKNKIRNKQKQSKDQNKTKQNKNGQIDPRWKTHCIKE